MIQLVLSVVISCATIVFCETSSEPLEVVNSSITLPLLDPVDDDPFVIIEPGIPCKYYGTGPCCPVLTPSNVSLAFVSKVYHQIQYYKNQITQDVRSLDYLFMIAVWSLDYLCFSHIVQLTLVKP